jgi:two-component system, NarL family, sensor histidine kinase DesK
MDPRSPLRERGIIVSILDAIKKKPRGLPVIPWLVVPLLGLFFLVYPIRVLFASDLSTARTAFALGGAALFAGVFLWLMLTRKPLQLVTAEPSEVLKVRVAIAFLVVLAGTLGFGVGPEWRMLFFYHINVAAGIMLPKRDAYVTIAAIAILTLVAGASTGFWWLAAPAIAIGLWSTTFVGQVAAVAQLKAAREELARLAVSEERLRFARDLHDLLGHSLSLITLKSELAERLLPDTPENRKAIEEVRGLQGVARGALKEVREAVSGYRRPSLDEELAGACAMLEAAGISCRARKEVESLTGDAEGILTWVVREGATNVVRHSRAKRCEIRLTRTGGRVRAEVRDDGPGPRPKRADNGVGGSGLAGLAERVRASGGQLEAGPLPDGGFGLRVMLPPGENDCAETGGRAPSEVSASERAQ